MSPSTRGAIYGFIGVAIFSLTLPFSHLAVKELDPFFVSIGRAAVAGVVSVIILLVTRQPWPTQADALRLLAVVGGVIFGFPVFSTVAMKTVDASHGTVVLGLLPLSTAFMSTIFAGERPTPQFWAWGLLGSALVVSFALWQGNMALRSADILLLLAVLAAGMGYAAGGALSRRLGGWQVICWALVIALPVTVPITIYLASKIHMPVHAVSWVSFLYLALFSQLIGFFAWNAGLATGGVAKVGQIQLLQTFMTLFAAWAFFGDALSPRAIIFACLVGLSVWMGRKAQVAGAR
ncbi:MAG: DMT family transporter [Hyphomicrobiales bacterium]